MALEDQVSVLFTYGVQSDIATPASAGGTSQRLRRMPGSGLVGARAGQRSPEVRADQQGADILDGPRSVSGSLIMPLATVACDDWLQYGMRAASWTNGVELDESDFTNLSISSGIVTLGSGNPSTLGLRVGRIYDLSGLSTPANNIRVRITAMTSSTFTAVGIDGTQLTNQGADTDCAITEVGKSLLQGTSKYALTIEQNYPSLDASEVFESCRPGGFQISMPPAGPCQMTVPITGLDWEHVESGSAPYFSNVTAASETPVLEMAGGEVVLAGASYSVTGLDLSLNIALMPNGPLVGRETGTEIFYGVSLISGNISMFLQDVAQLNLFRLGTEVDFHAMAKAADGSFYAFNAHRVKLMNQQKTIGADSGVLLQIGFEAQKKAAATGYSATTLDIQRSNT